ncbi:hypothetical protein Tco_0316639 [Tanacetum coccineum]
METIHVQFDELTHMAFEQFGSRPELKPLTSGHMSSKLVPNSAPSTSSNLPSKKDLDILFQPMFNEYFKPLPSTVSLTISGATLPQDTTGAASLIYIDQDAPSPSTKPNTETITTPIQDANVEEPDYENEDFDVVVYEGYFIHNSCWHALSTDTYSASVVEMASAVCFLENQDVRQHPMKVQTPLVLLRSS